MRTRPSTLTRSGAYLYLFQAARLSRNKPLSMPISRPYTYQANSNRLFFSTSYMLHWLSFTQGDYISFSFERERGREGLGANLYSYAPAMTHCQLVESLYSKHDTLICIFKSSFYSKKRTTRSSKITNIPTSPRHVQRKKDVY